MKKFFIRMSAVADLLLIPIKVLILPIVAMVSAIVNMIRYRETLTIMEILVCNINGFIAGLKGIRHNLKGESLFNDEMMEDWLEEEFDERESY